jgi:MFS family permease
VVYTLTLTLAMRPLGAFIFGAFADQYGRKAPMIVCVLYFSTMTVFSRLERLIWQDPSVLVEYQIFDHSSQLSGARSFEACSINESWNSCIVQSPEILDKPRLSSERLWIRAPVFARRLSNTDIAVICLCRFILLDRPKNTGVASAMLARGCLADISTSFLVEVSTDDQTCS